MKRLFILAAMMSLPGLFRHLHCQEAQLLYRALSPAVRNWAVSPEGRVVAYTEGTGKLIRLKEVVSGRPLGVLEGHTRPVQLLQFDPGREQLISGDSRQLIFWNFSEHRPVGKLELPPSPDGNYGNRTSYLLLPDQERLLISAGAATRSVDLQSGVVVAELEKRTRAKAPQSGAGRMIQMVGVEESEWFWAFDPADGELRKVKLHGLEVMESMRIRGARAMTGDKERVVVLQERVGRSDRPEYFLQIYDPALQLVREHPMRLTPSPQWKIWMDVHSKNRLLMTNGRNLLEVDLETMEERPYYAQTPDWGLWPLPDGSTVQVAGNILKKSDAEGRLTTVQRLADNPRLCRDPLSGASYLLCRDSLLDIYGQVRLRLKPEDTDWQVAEICGDRLVVATTGGRFAVYHLEHGYREKGLGDWGRPLSAVFPVPGTTWLGGFAAGDKDFYLQDWTGARSSVILKTAAPITAASVDSNRVFLGDALGKVHVFEIPSGKLLKIFQAMPGRVTALAVEHKRNWLLAAGKGRIDFFETRKFDRLRTIRGHTGFIQQLSAYSADDRLLTMAVDGTLKMWDIFSGRLLHHFEPNGWFFEAAHFLPDTAQIGILTQRGHWLTLPFSLTEEPNALPSFEVGNPPGVAADELTLQADGRLLAARDAAAGSVQLWDIPAGMHLQSLEMEDADKLLFLPRREVLVALHTWGYTLWEPYSGKQLQKVDYSFSGLDLSDMVLSSGGEMGWAIDQHRHRLLHLQLHTGDIAREIRLPVQSGPDEPQWHGLAVSPDDRLLAVADDSLLYLLYLPEGRIEHTAKYSGPARLALSFSPDSRFLLAHSEGGSQVAVYPVADLSDPKVTSARDAIFLDERRVVLSRAVASDSSRLYLWDYQKEDMLDSLFTPHRAPIERLALAVRARQMVSVDSEGRLVCWDDLEKKEGYPVHWRRDLKYRAILSPQGRGWLFRDQDHWYWLEASSFQTRKLEDALSGFPPAFAPDGKSLYYFSSWDTLVRHSLATDQVEQMPLDRKVDSLVMYPDGRRAWLRYSPDSAGVKFGFFDLFSGEWLTAPSLVLPDSTRFIPYANFGDNDSLLLVRRAYDPEDPFAGSDSLFVWNLKTQRVIHAWKASGKGAEPALQGWSASGQFRFFARKDAVYLQDLISGKMEEICRRSGIASVALSPGARFLFVGTEAGVVYQFEVETGREIIRSQNLRAPVRELHVCDDFVCIGDGSSLYRLLDRERLATLVGWIGLGGANVEVFTPDGLFMGSASYSRGLAFRLGERLYPLEQFDWRYRRPGEVLARMPQADPETVGNYREKTREWLHAQGMEMESMEGPFHLPELVMLSDPSLYMRDSLLEVRLLARDDSAELERFLIRVNDSLLVDLPGTEVPEENKRECLKTLTIPLKPGPNRVQLSVRNKAGVESGRVCFLIVSDLPIRIGSREKLLIFGAN